MLDFQPLLSADFLIYTAVCGRNPQTKADASAPPVPKFPSVTPNPFPKFPSSIYIVINFPNHISGKAKSFIEFECRYLLKHLIKLKVKYNIPNIRFGYEPAADDDACLININQNEIDLDKMNLMFL